MIIRLMLLTLWWPAIAQPQRPESFRERSRAVEARRIRDNVPAISIAVAKDGRLVWREAFGFADLQRRAPATVEVPFPVGSVSKPLTATALIALVEARRLDLDRAANTYLGEAQIQGHVSSADAVTLRALASHSSGISRHDLYYYEPDTVVPISIDERIRRYGHAVRPVGNYEYSNLNYMVLAHIISRVSGKSFAEHLRRELFLPLSMDHTTIGVPGGNTVALSYSAARIPVTLREETGAGAGGVYATATDLAKFGLFHLGHSPSSAAPPPISGETLQAMRRSIVQTGPGNWYGLGWRIDSTTFADEAILHTGSNGASASVLILVPSLDLCVVALANTLTDIPGWVVAEVVRAYGGGRTAGNASPEATSGPFGSRPFRATSDWTGTWSGAIATYDGDVPVRISIDDSGAISLQLRDAPAARAGGVRWETVFLRGSFDGELGTSDTRGRRYRLHFKLQSRGHELFGAVTAASVAGEPVITLSQFVRLQRQ